MFKLRGKKIITILCTHILLNWAYDILLQTPLYAAWSVFTLLDQTYLLQNID